ncbi:inositol monophosphatase [Chitinispirillales bacterium ANBcel5]|uniref:inositol monophosphatase family protein n=1 Tax=Cellulosispirillum alkaliphilum TaxID=3039283 RepID=UPI002A58C4D5|nr:inositol monophosphatase [Chitinispirillales bacterium ANBcel5]
MLKKELSTALLAAQKAGAIQKKGLGTALSIERKSDCSPVTQIDQKCEQTIKEIILNEYPEDGFLGEETEEIATNNGRRWIVDPLDGTRPFIRRIPTYSVLIALEQDNEPVLGVIYLPAMDCMCYGTKGGGAFINNNSIKVSPTLKLQNAMGSVLGYVENANQPIGPKLLELMKRWDYTYGFMDAYSYVCLASGKIDICVNLLDKPWDCAAAACIIREAGGYYTDIKGNDSIHNGSILFTNKHLHSEILSVLNNP